MKLDKTGRTELRRTFLVEALPESVDRRSEHLQIFDNYIHETRLRLRSIRVPATKECRRLLQKRYAAGEHGTELVTEEIQFNEAEYKHFKMFEGNEIRKNRYIAEFGGREFEFDVYLGPLTGTVLARVKFADRAEMDKFAAPSFAVIEVSDVPFFDGPHLVDRNFEDVQEEAGRLKASAAAAMAGTAD